MPIETVVLPNARAATTRLGFGCAYLTGGWELRQNRRLIDLAFEAGFRHFDVAPPYGIGTAEDVLGQALTGERRSRVAIVSKVGLPRGRLTVAQQMLRLVAKPLRRSGVWRRRQQPRLPHRPVSGCFTVSFVRHSLMESLRRLHTDYLDVLLLHEATVKDISDELLAFLEMQRREGTVRALGVAADWDAVNEITAVHRGLFDVVQYPWNVMDVGRVDAPSQVRCRVTHRAIMGALPWLRTWVGADRGVAKRLSAATGRDLSRDHTLSSVLVGAALAHNPGGVVLVGSRREKHVEMNAAVLHDETIIGAGAALIRAIAREPARSGAAAPSSGASADSVL